jgi:hypothetical protein
LPDNFIFLCPVCHRQQPDQLPKEVLKYWLYTRESWSVRADRETRPLVTALEMMKEEFGDLLVDRAVEEFNQTFSFFQFQGTFDQFTTTMLDRDRRSPVGTNRDNRFANFLWGFLQDIYAWCVERRPKAEVTATGGQEPVIRSPVGGS